MEKSITVLSYYSPEELTGIGKYNGELINWLSNRGYKVISLSNAPFYPHWKIYNGYSNSFYSNTSGNLIDDVRSWVYVPESPGALKKILSELSFFFSSTVAFFLNWRKIRKSSLIIVVNPPFFLGTLPVFFPFLKAKVLFHIQDLQVDAARELKLLPRFACSLLEMYEKLLLRKADYISTISQGMIRKIEKKNVSSNILLLPNWANLESVRPIPETKWLHNFLGIHFSKKLIVYSGNIGEKQGLDTVVEAASLLRNRSDIQFVILGEGLYKNTLYKRISEAGLDNTSLGSLVPKDNINDMLNSSFIQLVIQKSEGADSFLPSKLTNILAAGCASIVTAAVNTTLYDILETSKAAKLIKPDSGQELSTAVVELLNNNAERLRIKLNARIWAERNLSIDGCLSPLLNILA